MGQAANRASNGGPGIPPREARQVHLLGCGKRGAPEANSDQPIGHRRRPVKARKLSSLRCAPVAHDDHWHGSVGHIDLGLDANGWWHRTVLAASRA